jgi:adenylosuccinate lyase
MAHDAGFTHDTYLSPFTWRYGSERMRAIWSEAHKRRLWRRVWVALATAQAHAGVVTAEQVADLRDHQDAVDPARSAEIEAEIRHDIVAELQCFAEQCAVGGGILHLGATSADIEDNADVMRLQESLDLLIERLRALLTVFAEQIDDHADQVCLGFTHLQPAEPTTVGYRLAGYAQDLLDDYRELKRVRADLRGKGIKGAVGTSAAFAQMLAGTGVTPSELEALVMAELGLAPFAVATQVYPRRQDWRVLATLSGLALSLYRFAFDLRLMQSAPVGEWSEPFGERQVGSSAMPFKRNPINAENVDSLARYVATLSRVAWDNAAHSFLERTLDDKANRRIILPGAFLATEELLQRAERILRGLQIHEATVARNLAAYGVFAATEPLLVELVRNGADRQRMHERIRGHAMAAWEGVWAGRANPLAELLVADEQILEYLPAERVGELLDSERQVGDAPQRAREMAVSIRDAICHET